MYEINEHSRVLGDGTEITTYGREVVSANILDVEAGTTGYKGGDSGHEITPFSLTGFKPR